MEKQLEDRLVMMARSPDKEMNLLCAEIVHGLNLSSFEYAQFRTTLLKRSSVTEDKQIWRTIAHLNQILWNLKPLNESS